MLSPRLLEVFLSVTTLLVLVLRLPELFLRLMEVLLSLMATAVLLGNDADTVLLWTPRP
jgi:hypothetical protein